MSKIKWARTRCPRLPVYGTIVIVYQPTDPHDSFRVLVCIFLHGPYVEEAAFN